MRCHICNTRLEPNEIKHGPDGKWEPCGACLSAIRDDLSEDEDEKYDEFDLCEAHPMSEMWEPGQ